METVNLKIKRKYEDLLDYDVMAFEQQLPSQFKIPMMVKFNGSDNPKSHLTQYVALMSVTGLSKRHLLKMFGLSLDGAPVVWYYGL